MGDLDFLTRKAFLAKCGKACLAIGGISLIAQACKTSSYIPYELAEKKLSVKKADLGDKDFVLIRVEQLQAPIYLSKVEGKYHAVLMVCTHKACELTAYGKVLQCPCHGSEFDGLGKVLVGPAEQDLTRFTITEDENNIYIQ